MRILVTGGSGFIGSAYVRAAVGAGHEVAVLSRAARGSMPMQTTWLTGTLKAPPWSIIERFAPEVCLHAAWIATPGVYLESPENHDWVRWSFAFVNRLRAIGIRHITALGTCIEYQVTGGSLGEDATPLAPDSTYARSKNELHQMLLKMPADTNSKLAWARIFYPYGNGEHPARMASSLISKLRQGESVSLKTPRSTKDYIHVDDVAAALLTVMEQGFAGAINVGTGEGVTVETIARELGRLLRRSELIQVPENPPADPLDYVVADATRLHSLGWKPQVTLNAGLRRLVEARPS